MIRRTLCAGCLAMAAALVNRNKKKPTLFRRLSITLTTALLLVAFAPLTAKGDTITFVDVADTVTVLHDGTLDTIIPFSGSAFCVGEFCAVLLLRSGASPNGAGGTFFIAEDSSPTSLVSDSIEEASSLALGAWELRFFSDPAGESVFQGPCSGVGGCAFAENGEIQVAGTLSWTSGSDDTVQFCSDVEGGANTCGGVAVPEPNALLALGSGLAGLAGLVWRRACRT